MGRSPAKVSYEIPRFRNQEVWGRTTQDEDDDGDDEEGKVNLQSNSLCSFLHIPVSSILLATNIVIIISSLIS
jgi:hypothetical protein